MVNKDFDDKSFRCTLFVDTHFVESKIYDMCVSSIDRTSGKEALILC